MLGMTQAPTVPVPVPESWFFRSQSTGSSAVQVSVPPPAFVIVNVWEGVLVVLPACMVKARAPGVTDKLGVGDGAGDGVGAGVGGVVGVGAGSGPDGGVGLGVSPDGAGAAAGAACWICSMTRWTSGNRAWSRENPLPLIDKPGALESALVGLARTPLGPAAGVLAAAPTAPGVAEVLADPRTLSFEEVDVEAGADTAPAGRFAVGRGEAGGVVTDGVAESAADAVPARW